MENQREIEQLEVGVTKHWNKDRTVVTFTMSDVSRKAVDAYISGNLEVLGNWDKTKTLFTIQDISNPNISLTPYLKSRLDEITNFIKTNEVNVCTAIVMENNFTGQVMRAFGRLFTVNARYLNQVYFTDLTQATGWISKQKNHR